MSLQVTKDSLLFFQLCAQISVNKVLLFCTSIFNARLKTSHGKIFFSRYLVCPASPVSVAECVPIPASFCLPGLSPCSRHGRMQNFDTDPAAFQVCATFSCCGWRRRRAGTSSDELYVQLPTSFTLTVDQHCTAFVTYKGD